MKNRPILTRPTPQTSGSAQNYGLGILQPQFDDGITDAPYYNYADNFGLGDMTKSNAPNYGLGQFQQIYDDSIEELPTSYAQNYGMPKGYELPTPDVSQNSATNQDPIAVNPGVSSTVSGRRRDQSPMAYNPMTSPGDMLMRVGLAGLRGSQYGGLEALGSMGEEYGNIRDSEARGLAAFQKAQATAAAKNKAKPSAASPYNAVVLDELNQLIPLLDGDTSWFSAEAGLPGSILSMIPGTSATDFASSLDTLKANIGFDRLQKMRDDSPTGGALGQVSEMELRQLNAALGSLNQSQSPQKLQQNLIRIRDHYIRTVAALEAEYAAAGIDISSKIGPINRGNSAGSSKFADADAIVGLTTK